MENDLIIIVLSFLLGLYFIYWATIILIRVIIKETHKYLEKQINKYLKIKEDGNKEKK